MKNKKFIFQLNNTLDIIIDHVIHDYDVISSFSEILDFSKELYDHCVNVAFLSLIIGHTQYDKLNDIRDLFISALLHDYGKIFMPKCILNKPGKLDKKERQIIELHAAVGYYYLKNRTNISEKILIGISEHHEKIDGSGYGLQKKASEISLFGKIIAIADVYDAMISKRVYKEKRTPNYVFNYLISCKQFDEGLLNAFINIINEIRNELSIEDYQKKLNKQLLNACFEKNLFINIQ